MKKAYRCRKIYDGIHPVLRDGWLVTEGNRILYCGSVKDEILKECEIISRYEDNFIMPGFFDYHVHMINAAMLERDGVLRYATSEEEAAKQLWEKNKDRDDIEWLLGGAWDEILWGSDEPPKKETLDQYFPDVPVFLLNKEVHGAWVNTKLLETFHITNDTKDPEHGKIFRNGAGDPSGYLHEAASTMIQNQIHEQISEEEIMKYVKAFAKFANCKGITSVGDVAGNAPLRPKAYHMLEEKGELSVRVRFFPPMEDGVEAIERKKEQYHTKLLSAGGVKGFIDGTPMGYSGYMLTDYSDRPGFRSEPLWSQKELNRLVAEYDKAGIAVRIHACGDAGVKMCLDAYENAKKVNGCLHARHAIEHLEATDPEDLKRFGELGVIASVQPEHMPKYDFSKHPFHQSLGEERMKYSWPFETIRKNGGVLAFGTDCPVADLSPCRGIYRAVNRLTNEKEPENGFNPWERMDVYDAMQAYTYGSAYAAGEEADLGSLEPGKLADFIVLEKSIPDIVYDREEMFNLKTLLTVMDGKAVFSQK